MGTRLYNWTQIPKYEIAWAAGLFEGEGSIHLSQNLKPRISLTMSDEDSVRRFHTAIGNLGNIGNPRMPKGGTKMVWEWNAGKFEEVQQIVVMLWPGLGMRRRTKASEVLKGVRYVDRTRCQKGHLLTGANVIRRPKRPNAVECRECANDYQRDRHREKNNVPESKYRKARARGN